MSILLHLSALAVREVVDRACQSAGVRESGGAVVRLLTDHFTDHSQRLTRALQNANANAWRAVEIAVAGESFWERCKVFLSRADNQALGRQIRAFLDAAPLTGLPATPQFRSQCLAELRAARQSGLLLTGSLEPRPLAEHAAGFARFSDPQRVLDAEHHLIDQMAGQLRLAGHGSLAVLVTLRPAQEPPILVIAARYFLRREIENDRQLFQGLAFAKLETLAAGQEQAFAGLHAALTEQGARVEEMLGEMMAVVVETRDAVQDLQEQIRGQGEQIQQVGEAVVKLLEQHQLQKRELRPSDSLSIRSDSERQLVRKLVARYRALPESDRRRLPALLNAVGKLEVVAGDFEDAQHDFQQVAELTGDVRLQAEAHFHAYQAALQQRDWKGALVSLKEAVRLDGRRLAPFPTGKLMPLRILGAGGFGVAFLCQHKYMDAPVVVKALTGADLDQGIEQIFNEATLLRQLEHPAIIRMQDCGFTDPASKSRPYLVMDYFDGMTLEDHVRDRPLTPAACIDVGRQIAEGLRAAHKRGILHRDVKPANILIGLRATPMDSADSAEPKEGRPPVAIKLIDFGLALNRTALQNTQVSSKTLLGSSIAGTIDYAAPEQLGRLPGVAVCQASDIYGFAKTCCHALFQTPEPTLRHWQSIGPALAELLGQCLEKQPAQRPASFSVVLERLKGMSSAGPAAVQAGPPPIRQEDLDAARREASLREAAARAEGERRRLEEQELRLRDAAARAEAERLRLEERERGQRMIPSVMPAPRRQEYDRPTAPDPRDRPRSSCLSSCGCVMLVLLLILSGAGGAVYMVIAGNWFVGDPPSLAMRAYPPKGPTLRPHAQAEVRLTIKRENLAFLKGTQLDIQAPPEIQVWRTGPELTAFQQEAILQVKAGNKLGKYKVHVTPSLAGKKGPALEFEVEVTEKGSGEFNLKMEEGKIRGLPPDQKDGEWRKDGEKK